MHSNKRAKHENFYEGEGGQTLKAFRKWTKAMEWVDFLIQHVNDIWNETQRGLFPARKHRSEAFVALCLMAIGNKTAGRISKILYQCPAGFMFTHPPLWISWQCLFKGLLMLDCICQTKLFFQIYILYTDGLLLIKHDRHYIILHQLDQGLYIYIVLTQTYFESLWKSFMQNIEAFCWYGFSSCSPLNAVKVLQHVRELLLQWTNLWRHSSTATVSSDSNQHTHLSSVQNITYREKINGESCSRLINNSKNDISNGGTWKTAVKLQHVDTQSLHQGSSFHTSSEGEQRTAS